MWFTCLRSKRDGANGHRQRDSLGQNVMHAIPKAGACRNYANIKSHADWEDRTGQKMDGMLLPWNQCEADPSWTPAPPLTGYLTKGESDHWSEPQSLRSWSMTKNVSCSLGRNTARPLHTNFELQTFQDENLPLVPAGNQNLCCGHQVWAASQLARRLLPLATLQLYSLPRRLPPPSVAPPACSLDASPCVPAAAPHYCTFQGPAL